MLGHFDLRGPPTQLEDHQPLTRPIKPAAAAKDHVPFRARQRGRWRAVDLEHKGRAPARDQALEAS